jgi:hypothetical protein
MKDLLAANSVANCTMWEKQILKSGLALTAGSQPLLWWARECGYDCRGEHERQLGREPTLI